MMHCFLAGIDLPTPATVEAQAEHCLSDQAPGQTGLTNSDGVVWKCPACRTSNHKHNSNCGNCFQARRPSGSSSSADHSTLDAKERFEREKRAIEQAYREQLEASTRRYEEGLRAERDEEQTARDKAAMEHARTANELAVAELLTHTDLLAIATSGDPYILLKLLQLDALAATPDINQLHSFSPKGQDATVSAVSRHLLL